MITSDFDIKTTKEGAKELDLTPSEKYPGLLSCVAERVITNEAKPTERKYSDIFLRNIRVVITFDSHRKLNLWEFYFQNMLSNWYSPRSFSQQFYAWEYSKMTYKQLIKYRWLAEYQGCIAILGDKDCCHVISKDFVGIHSYTYRAKMISHLSYMEYGYPNSNEVVEDMQKIIKTINHPVEDFDFVSKIRNEATVRRIKYVNFIAEELRKLGFEKDNIDGSAVNYKKVLCDDLTKKTDDTRSETEKKQIKLDNCPKLIATINVSALIDTNKIAVRIFTTHSHLDICPFGTETLSYDNSFKDIPEQANYLKSMTNLMYIATDLKDLKSYLNIVTDFMIKLVQNCFGKFKFKYIGKSAAKETAENDKLSLIDSIDIRRTQSEEFENQYLSKDIIETI